MKYHFLKFLSVCILTKKPMYPKFFNQFFWFFPSRYIVGKFRSYLRPCWIYPAMKMLFSAFEKQTFVMTLFLFSFKGDFLGLLSRTSLLPSSFTVSRPLILHFILYQRVSCTFFKKLSSMTNRAKVLYSFVTTSLISAKKLFFNVVIEDILKENLIVPWYFWHHCRWIFLHIFCNGLVTLL